MDWSTVLSTAIGTMGGTLLTVGVAWLIYRSEREDIRLRNKRSHIVETTLKCIRLINSSTASIVQKNTIMQSISNVEIKEAQISLFGDLVKHSAKTEEMNSELYSGLSILESISDYKVLNSALPYINNLTNLTFEESYEDEESMDRKIKGLMIQRDKLIEKLQEILKQNSD